MRGRLRIGTILDPEFIRLGAFLKELKAWFGEAHFKERQLICGDFNVAPHPDDVWSHKQLLKVVSHTPIETEALDDLLTANHGWTDLVRKHHPFGEKLSSWWSYRARDWELSDRGRRLDHLWSSGNVAERLAGIEILREARGWDRPSDHVPVIARFDLD